MFLAVHFIGFVSNGEYNTMIVQGYTRPLSVLQIKADARNKYQKMGYRPMLDMLTPVGKLENVVSNPLSLNF